jgi:protein required for attachment to host cells
MNHDPTPIAHAALVVVGDGNKAFFYRNEGTPMHVKLVVEHVLEQSNPRTREQGTDKPGRYAGPDGNSRSAMEETDWHQLAENRFAQQISTELYRLAHANRFAQLILVAPPKIMGSLRPSLHQEVTKRIVAEIPKDLTGQTKEEIARLISGGAGGSA